MELLKEVSTAKFDETVELHIRTNVDPRHADQMIRGVCSLPHGLGKTIRVVVFAGAEGGEEARAAGADFVMLGGMLAGHDESGGELVEDKNGKMFKSFYGMSSAKAMETHYGEIAEHRAPEGKEVRVPYRGSLEVTIQSILGGLRSACSYVGARRIKDLPKCTTFIRVSMTTNEVFQKFNVD